MPPRRSFSGERTSITRAAKIKTGAPGTAPRPHPAGASRRDQSGPRHEAGPKASKQTATGPAEPGKPERLQKVLAHAGLGSRRSCEELILKGRVSVDGQIARQLGTRVDAAVARIAVDGEPIRLESIVYFAVNKPKGYVSTNFDPAGRPRVVDLLPELPERVYTVGRLDEDSTGLMILTNDGDLANRLAHPRFGVEKLYRALVAGLPGPETLAKLTEGIWLSDGKVRAKRARIVGRQGQATQLELVLAEGKKREIRRMLSKLGHKVMSLNRIAVGPISLKGLPTGECRPLSRHEVDLLRQVASGAPMSRPRSLGASSPSRPPHDSNRPRRGERPRPPRDDGRPQQQRPRKGGERHAPQPARRRIIGLEQEPASGPGHSSPGGRSRKRPPAQEPASPRRARENADLAVQTRHP